MSGAESVNLARFLLELKEKIYFYPNPGNAGDSLIVCATLQFFDRHNVNYEVISKPGFDAENKILVYAGGGNFGGDTSRVAFFLNEYKDVAKKVIILPHTIFGAEKLLMSLDSNCYLFCREMTSFQHVIKNAPNANVYHHHDMVFESNIRELLTQDTSPKFVSNLISEIIRRLNGNSHNDMGIGLNGFKDYTVFKIKRTLGINRKSGNVLNAFRTDVEKTGIEIPKNNIDVSAIFELSSCSPDLAKESTKAFLQEIDQYDEVNTNRLHVAVAAILLDKKVHIYANNYFKIRAIYDYSIKDRYNNVSWEN